MFNLFKNKKVSSVVNSVKQAFSEPMNEQEVIEKIHSDFDGAAERLLAEAQEIINNCNAEKLDKAARLKALGFDKSSTVKESEEEARKKNEMEEISRNILYFKQHYPFNKFITEKEVEKICKKYSLVFGDAKNYKGEIPNKNLNEIENFKLRQEDMVRTSDYDRAIERYFAISVAQARGHFGDRSYSRAEYPVRPPESEMKYYYSKSPFKMCAPEKDFDMTYYKTEGYKIVPKDPIVLQPVKGGYLIVSKWGLEASDELVVNSIDN